jgi:aryl-alcohol dehydrogenase
MKIKAAVTKEKGAPFSIEEVELAAPKADEILVKIKAAGVCHTDEAGRSGELPFAFPVVLGHEGAGIVEAVGSAVTDFVPGDTVCISFGTCGSCEPCLSGRPYACEKMFTLNFSGTMSDGTKRLSQNGKEISSFFAQSSFAAYAVINQRSAVKIEKDIDLGLAAPLGCGIQTGAGCVMNVLKPEIGSTIAVFGIGPVGLSAIMAANIIGCYKIIAIDKIPSRLALAQEIGATHIINGGETQDMAGDIMALTGGRGLNYAVDTSGSKFLANLALNSLSYTGKLMLAAGGTSLTLTTGAVLGAKTVMGVNEGNSIPKVFIPKLLSYYKKGKFPLDKLISYFRFEEINEAFEASHQGETIKAVLRFDD